MSNNKRNGVILSQGLQDITNIEPGSMQRSPAVSSLDGFLESRKSDKENVFEKKKRQSDQKLKRLSTYSVNSMASTSSTKSSTSLKNMALKFGNALSSISVYSDSSKESNSEKQQVFPVITENSQISSDKTADSTRKPLSHSASNTSLSQQSLNAKSSLSKLRGSFSIRSRNKTPAPARNSIYSHADDASSIYSNASARPSLLGRSMRRSFLSLKPKKSIDDLSGKSWDKSMISLPVPQVGSKEKLKNKLRNSSSILSISSYVSVNDSQDDKSTEVVTVPTVRFEHFQLDKLLELTGENKVVPMQDFIKGYKVREKVLETKYTDSYLLEDSLMVKVCAFGNDLYDQPEVSELIQELRMSQHLAQTPNFQRVKISLVVKGGYPLSLLSAWDEYSRTRGTAGFRPDAFSSDQHYLVMVAEDQGVSLKEAELHTWVQSSNFFLQLCHVLSRGESFCQFEHRDLHWENILVDQYGSPVLINYSYSRAVVPSSDGHREVLFSRLDQPFFFKGNGDYRFDIYRLTRQVFSRGKPQMDWAAQCPRTNLLWAHYVLDRLVYHKGLSPPKTREDRAAYEKLISLHKYIDPRRRSRFMDLQNVDDLLRFI